MIMVKTLLGNLFKGLSWVLYRLSGFFFRFASVLNNIGFYFTSSKAEQIQRKWFDRWYKAEGDYNLRLDYHLDSNSIVIDAGGFLGAWSKEIFARFGSNIFIFEPISYFHRHLTNYFSNNPKVKVIQAGLGNFTRKEFFKVANESSSTFLGVNKSENTEECQILDFIFWCKSNNITKIDLFKINIEGGEYELLDAIIGDDLIHNVKNLQIQFHINLPNFEDRIAEIRKNLEKTHKLTWCYEFVWENWQLKS